MRDKARVVVRREIPSLRGKNIWTRSKLLDLGVTREWVSYSRHMVMREDDFLLLLHFSPADWQLLARSEWHKHICLFAVHLTLLHGNGAEKNRTPREEKIDFSGAKEGELRVQKREMTIKISLRLRRKKKHNLFLFFSPGFGESRLVSMPPTMFTPFTVGS